MLFCWFYTLSIQPAKREKKYGEKSWKNCMILRSIAGFLEFIITINMILWIWFPILIFSWKVDTSNIFNIIIAIIISTPALIVMFLGIKAAGSESIQPSKETEMYGGIYQYIRHPQSLGEFPLFVAIGFLVNSWFLVILMALFIFTYVPIMIFYEEKDLILRFGDSYKEYQIKTGALFPKFKK